jgi:hypothetical protein
MLMSCTTVDVDSGALEAARLELGTQGVSANVSAALREVGRRRALAAFDVVRDIDGTPAEVDTNRQDRHTERQD